MKRHILIQAAMWEIGRVMDRLQEALLVRIVKLFSILISLLLVLSPLWAANIYVDSTLGGNITNGTYSIASRNNEGSDGNAYTTIQAAINACSTGDTIYMRGGTYNETDIDIPTSKNGTAWTAGNFTTLCSYPGEWAIVDGQRSNPNYHPSVFKSQSFADNDSSWCRYDGCYGEHTAYWKFERFEVTGAGYSSDLNATAGFLIAIGPCWWRYMYIHDNYGSDGNATLPTGIYITCGSGNIIEYSYFKNNGATSTYKDNGSDIAFHADYREDNNTSPYIDGVLTGSKQNIVRYNYLYHASGDATLGSMSIKYKSQQRFHSEAGDSGTAYPTTATDIYNTGSTWYSEVKELGDKWHHNVVKNGPIFIDQDFGNVYNNIVDNSDFSTQMAAIQSGYEYARSAQSPTMYHSCIYNNTVLNFSAGIGHGSGDAATEDRHYWIYLYNNILSNEKNDSGYYCYPFSIAHDMASADTYPLMTNIYVKNNLIHAPAETSIALARGRRADYTATTLDATFDSCSGNVQDNTDNSDLFGGSSGYITQTDYPGMNIASGGIGGSHPYLSGVTIPSYVGAVNPSDSDWVAGVISLATTSGLASAENGSTPSWVEGEGSGSTPTCQGISVQ